MTTKDSLWIVAFDGEGHNELSGIAFYGLFKNQIDFDSTSIKSIWNGFAIIQNQVWYKDYSVCSIQIVINEFPSNEVWKSLIKNTLESFINTGAYLAWCGDESCYASLDIFDPQQSSGNIYSCLLKNKKWFFNASLEDEIVFLDDEQLLNVKHFLEEEGPRHSK